MVRADEVGGGRLRGHQYQVQVENGAGIGVELIVVRDVMGKIIFVDEFGEKLEAMVEDWGAWTASFLHATQSKASESMGDI
jgi:hypothetical protein